MSPEGAGRLRVGQGVDVHRFSQDPARALVLGGVHVEDAPGLEGHSDADVVCHALCDALLGAAGLGDLGAHFADTDRRWAGARSLDLLGHVVSLLDADGLRALNADCTVICERPLLAPYTGAMGRQLGGVLGAPVSVKATRAEGLGALGRAEGIACLAVALVDAAGAAAGEGAGPIS